ncbi:MAG: hypothetical protein EBU40_13065 [Proteobacteria bacterium]|nr:hypothetical protein [Pseudomonadota bacterium]
MVSGAQASLAQNGRPWRCRKRSGEVLATVGEDGTQVRREAMRRRVVEKPIPVLGQDQAIIVTQDR